MRLSVKLLLHFCFFARDVVSFIPWGCFFPSSLNQMQSTLLQTAPFYFTLHQVMGKHRFKSRDVPENEIPDYISGLACQTAVG